MIKVGDKLPEGTLSEFIEVEGNGCTIGPNTFKVEEATKPVERQHRQTHVSMTKCPCRLPNFGPGLPRVRRHGEGRRGAGRPHLGEQQVGRRRLDADPRRGAQADHGRLHGRPQALLQGPPQGRPGRARQGGAQLSNNASGFASEVDGCVEQRMGSWTFGIPKDGDGEPTDAQFKIQLQFVPD